MSWRLLLHADADYASSLQFYALQNNTDRQPVVLAQL